MLLVTGIKLSNVHRKSGFVSTLPMFLLSLLYSF